MIFHNRLKMGIEMIFIMKYYPLVYGHRGFPLEAPENTIPSFLLAREAGAFGVEMDVHMTKDGELVVIHDDKLDRTTTGTGYVSQRTWAEVRQLDAGQKFSERWRGVRVPSLREVLTQVKGVNYYVEVKHGSRFYPGIEERLLEILEETGTKDLTQVISFDLESLSRLRQMDSSLTLGLLTCNNVKHALLLADKIGVNWIQAEFGLLDRELVDMAHGRGYRVATWTVNTEEEVMKAREMGVDSITTDDPRMAIRVLSS